MRKRKASGHSMQAMLHSSDDHDAPQRLIHEPLNSAELLALSMSFLSPGLEQAGDTPPPPLPPSDRVSVPPAQQHARASEQIMYNDAIPYLPMKKPD